MRSDEDIRQFMQSRQRRIKLENTTVVEVEGAFLTFEDVQRGTTEPPAFKGMEKGLRIEERPPSRIDDEGTWLHLADPLTIQEVVGLHGEWCVERDDIALRQQCIEGHAVERGVSMTVRDKYPTAETLQPFDDFSSDTSCSDHTDCHVTEFPSGYLAQSIVVRL